MFNGNYELNGEALKVVEEIGRNMPGGFFIYKAMPPEELLYANQAVYTMFGCRDLEEFKELTGYTFRGMLHPDDYEQISSSIVEQIEQNDDNIDYVEYRIIRKDGSVRWVDEDAEKASRAKTQLGLAISSRMLALMNSSLKVKSEYERGSEFSFVIGQKIVDQTEIGKFDPLTAANVGTRQGNQTLSFTAPNARVMIVDDTPLNLQVVVGLLKRTEIQIDTAASGYECLQLFGSDRHYDMLFLDYRMPDMDGIETLKKLYELYPDKAKKTPMVCLTASAVTGDREKMLNAGFDDYLSKPVNITKMEGMMIKYLPEEKVTLVRPDEPESEYMGILPPEIFKLDEIDPAVGVEYCGGAEDYMDAVAVFSMSIAQKSADIETSCRDKDLPTFINLVHSLKSTSRIIGATGISELAFALEQAGKAGNTAVMNELTPKLLAKYRKLQQPLEGIVDVRDETH